MHPSGLPALTSRRSLLAGLALAPFAASVTSCADSAGEGSAQPPARRALVYRGPAGCEGCSETLAERLAGAPLHMDVTFIGPDESTPLDAQALMGTDLYVQPGGGDDIPAAAEQFASPFVRALGDFVSGGGRYLGVCMGAYLAGSDAFGLIPHNIEGEVNAPGFPVTDSADRLVMVTWGDTARWTYFQEGARLPAAGAQTYAHYENGDIAAARYSLGRGSVGLIGPHPEADATWLEDAALTDPDGDDWAYVAPFVQRLLS